MDGSVIVTGVVGVLGIGGTIGAVVLTNRNTASMEAERERRDEAEWLRTARRLAYVRFLEAVEEFTVTRIDEEEGSEFTATALAKVFHARSSIAIVGSDQAITKAKEVWKLLVVTTELDWDAIGDKRKEFEHVARKDGTALEPHEVANL